MKTLLKSLVILFLSTNFLSCTYFLESGEESFKKRLTLLDSKKWSTKDSVEVYWSETAIPFIYASNDEDLFYTTGLLQGLLRQGQLEIFRHLSQGRLSELIGKQGNDIDVFIRTIDFSRTAEESLVFASDEERLVIKSFVKGLNDYIKHSKDRISFDLQILGLKEIKPWTEKELITLHKFFGADVNWTVLPKFLKISEDKSFSKFWKKWFVNDQDLVANKEISFLNESVFNYTGEVGSNAFAIRKIKTKSRKAPIVAGDPHLGLKIPNLWFLMGQFSPSINTFGVFMPSLPVAVMGRNKDLAWTGTNMWGLSSYLFKLSKDEEKELTLRKEIIKTRFSKDKTVIIRESRKGPIVSDTRVFKFKDTLALYWAGHHYSNELGSFLKANKSRSVQEFKKAFSDYGQAPLNFIVADKLDNISKMHVLKQPILNDLKEKRIIQRSANFVVKHKKSSEFKAELNPKESYLVSANEVNNKLKPSPMWFNPPDYRKKRISDLLDNNNEISFKEIKEIQTDTYLEMSKTLIFMWEDEFKVNDLKPRFLQVLLKWNFLYEENLEEPYIFEELAASFARDVFLKKGFLNKQIEVLFNHSSWKMRAQKEYFSLSNDLKKEVLNKLAFFSKNLVKGVKWGDVHRLNLSHPLAKIPLLGRYFSFYDGPYPGGNDTVFKASHKSGKGDYNTSFGANLRLIYDLSDEDNNFVCLMGGQDGALKSPHNFDQFGKWRRGEYYKVNFLKKNFIKKSRYKSLIRPI